MLAKTLVQRVLCGKRLFCTNSAAGSRNLRADILEASIKNVAALGWTQECIAKGVMDLDLPPLTHRVLGRGPVELVEHFIDKKRNFAKERVADLQAKRNQPQSSAEPDSAESRRTDSYAQATHNNPLTTDEILQEAIEAHIDYIAPYIHTWPSALALFADPMQMSVAMTTGLQLADDIVTFGGIETSRGDWYTERLLAIMLYTSTELYLLTDSSPNFADTR
jgi:ubiquinone biosynthesis protein COQ9